jgi:hypothetical protein
MEREPLTCAKCGKADELVGLYGTLPADFNTDKTFEVPDGLENFVYMHLACAKEG